MPPRPATADFEHSVMLPGALRPALPQDSNEVVGMLHATAIAGTVTLMGITRVARDVHARHLLPADAFGTAAVIDVTMTSSLVGAFRLLELRFLRHLQTERGADAAQPAPAPARPA